MKIPSVFWHSVVANSTVPEHFDITDPSVVVFEEHIKFLRENYTPITVVEFLRIRQDRRSIRSYDRPPVLLGFDDGFKNVASYALPVLEEYKIPALFFVLGEIIRDPNFVPWYVEVKHLIRRAEKNTVRYGNKNLNLSLRQDRLGLRRIFDAAVRACTSEANRRKLLTDLADVLGVRRPRGADLDEDLMFVGKEDLTKLSSSSFLTVASHAMTHRYLATLTYEEQVYEIEQSDRLLREYCRSYYPVIAYPLGSFNNDTINIASRCYKAGFATLVGSSYRKLYAYPRIGLSRITVPELAYALCRKRLDYILPLKRFLYATGVRAI